MYVFLRSTDRVFNIEGFQRVNTLFIEKGKVYKAKIWFRIEFLGSTYLQLLKVLHAGLVSLLPCHNHRAATD